jgi:hypothetical protein
VRLTCLVSGGVSFAEETNYTFATHLGQHLLQEKVKNPRKPNQPKRQVIDVK